MGTTRVAFQDVYLLQLNSTDIGDITEKPTYEANTIGIEGTGAADDGKYGIPTEEHAHLQRTETMIIKNLARGTADNSLAEFTQITGQAGAASISMVGNAYNLAPLLWSFFQTGANDSSGGGVETLTCVPYASPDPEMFFSLLRVLDPVANNASAAGLSHYMVGCIVKTLKISAQENDIFAVEADIVGANTQTTTESQLSGASKTWSTIINTHGVSSRAGIKWSDFTVEIDGSAAKLPGFELSMDNNVGAAFYNSATIQNYVLGNIGGEINITVPMSDTTYGNNAMITSYFTSGTDFQLELYTTDGASTANSIDLQLNCIINNFETVTLDATGEVGHQCTCTLVNDGTYSGMNIKVGYDETILSLATLTP